MSTNLYDASKQWATRPNDQRHATLEECRDACKAYADTAVVSKPTAFSDLRIEATDGDLRLVGKTDAKAAITHYAFGQICRNASSPADFVRQLPATLAAQVINHRLAKTGEETAKRNQVVLFHQRPGDGLIARAITSDLYDRVWNWEVIEKGLLPLKAYGWRVPPARPATVNQPGTRVATAADILPGQEDFGLSVKVGDLIAPAGIYASDHDLFVFLVNPERGIKAPGGRELATGCFVEQSEVGDKALNLKWFDYDAVCGNHIVWGAENVKSISVRHLGTKNPKTLDEAVRQFSVALREYEEVGVAEKELKLRKAASFQIGATKDAVLEAVFAFAKTKRLTAITHARIDAAIDTATVHADRYGNPYSAWGVVSGLTENSQGAFGDERTVIDTQAAKVLEIAF